MSNNVTNQRRISVLLLFAPKSSGPSVSVPFSENLEDRLDQDQEVKPGTPIINVPQIELHTRCDMFDCRGGSPGAVALCPTGYARLDVIAKSIVAQYGFKVAVVSQCVRTWPYQGHVADQHIPELRQIIETRGPNQPSNGRYT